MSIVTSKDYIVKDALQSLRLIVLWHCLKSYNSSYISYKNNLFNVYGDNMAGKKLCTYIIIVGHCTYFQILIIRKQSKYYHIWRKRNKTEIEHAVYISRKIGLLVF